PGYLFGVVSRKVIGTGCVLALTRILRKPIAWDAHALHVYLVSGSAIYGAMLAVYWGAQFIPSGWISIIFGLTPIITTAMAAVWLDEPMLT
ncbi:MAG: EamA family transporter, partial [Gammaproteobacteria bacterium]|nr:EamA family transporter [Gammaproteobacteria bacterium]